MENDAIRVTLLFTGEQAAQLRDLSKRECLPMVTIVRQIVLKYLAKLSADKPQ